MVPKICEARMPYNQAEGYHVCPTLVCEAPRTSLHGVRWCIRTAASSAFVRADAELTFLLKLLFLFCEVWFRDLFSSRFRLLARALFCRNGNGGRIARRRKLENQTGRFAGFADLEVTPVVLLVGGSSFPKRITTAGRRNFLQGLKERIYDSAHRTAAFFVRAISALSGYVVPGKQTPAASYSVIVS